MPKVRKDKMVRKARRVRRERRVRRDKTVPRSKVRRVKVEQQPLLMLEPPKHLPLGRQRPLVIADLQRTLHSILEYLKVSLAVKVRREMKAPL